MERWVRYILKWYVQTHPILEIHIDTSIWDCKNKFQKHFKSKFIRARSFIVETCQGYKTLHTWWLNQPISQNMLVNLDHLPKDRSETLFFFETTELHPFRGIPWHPHGTLDSSVASARETEGAEARPVVSVVEADEASFFPWATHRILVWGSFTPPKTYKAPWKIMKKKMTFLSKWSFSRGHVTFRGGRSGQIGS